MKSTYTLRGVGFGSALAMVLGHAVHHSLGWTIVDGLLGWFYVLWTIL